MADVSWPAAGRWIDEPSTSGREEAEAGQDGSFVVLAIEVTGTSVSELPGGRGAWQRQLGDRERISQVPVTLDVDRGGARAAQR